MKTGLLVGLGLTLLACSSSGGGGGNSTPWPTYTTERVARVPGKTVVKVDPRCHWRPDETDDRGVATWKRDLAKWVELGFADACVDRLVLEGDMNRADAERLVAPMHFPDNLWITAKPVAGVAGVWGGCDGIACYIKISCTTGHCKRPAGCLANVRWEVSNFCCKTAGGGGICEGV